MKRWLEVSLVPSLVVVAVLACVLCDPSSLQSDVPVSRPNEGLSTASDTLDKEGEAISLDGLSVEQLKQAREQAVKRHFEAEVDRMMKIIVNSLYKNKEIFLRELISNASDALDKIRVLALTNSEVLEESDEMNIRIKANKETRTLHIIDTGIGMTEAELTSNLGTIAKSGTSEFLANITQATSSSEKSDLIGQFGVGFYSSFLVMVVSKSDAITSTFGSRILLHLVCTETHVAIQDYLQPETLKEVVKKYSQFINFPIYVWSSRTESQSIEPEEKDDTKTSDSEVEEESVKKTEGKTVDKVVWDWVRVNANKPIWRRKPSDVTDKEYNELFHVYSKDYDDPLARIHFTGEGDVMFNSILYIPKRSPSNIFQMHSSHSDRIKLYVRRVYISDVADDLLPKYLAFVVGIVDSDELPLNVSREMLQQNKLLKAIKKRLVKKVIEMISKLTESDFEKFWSEYSVNIKLGIIDDHSNRSKLSKILRFWTSNSSEKQSSLADYVSRMKKGQDEIYYITAASLNEAKSSPFVERLTKKGYEIIYMVDPVDEYMLQSLTEYDKKKLRNVAKGAIELDKSDGAKTRKEALQKEFEPLLEWFKENLKEYVDQTALSERLLNTPCALVANEFGWSGNMERIMTAQAYQRGGDPSTTYYATMKKVFEINPRHPVMKKLNNLIKSNRNDPTINHTANLLFDVAVLRSGFSVKSPVAFAERVESVVKKSLDIDPTEMVEQEQEVDDESNDKVIVTDEEVEEKPISSESVTENASEESLQDNIYKDIWRQNRTEGSKLSSSELGSISEHSRRIPVIPSSESDILSEFGAIQKCPTCRRLLGCNSRVHTTRSESSVADDSTDVKYEKDDRYQVIEDDDDNDNEDDEISDNQIETDDDKEEEEVDEDSGVDLGEEISESNIKTTFRHMRKLEESIDDDDDHDDTDNDDSDTEYRNCLSMCASRHKKKQYLRYTVTNKSEQEDEQDDDADEEGDHDEEDLVLLSVAETKTTPSNPKSLSDASVDKQQVNEEKTLKTTEQKSEEITKEQNISKQKDGDNDEEDSDDADDDEVDSHHQEDEDDSDNDDDDNNSDVPRSDCHQGVRNDKQFLREDEDADANDVEDDGEENDDVNTDTPDADDDAGDDDDEQVVSTEYKFDMSKTKSSGHNQHTNVKVEEDYTNEYDETEDVEEESEDDQPEDLDLEISAEEGYEDVDDPDFSDWIEADEELNPNWPGSRKLMTVKTTSSPTAKSKSHSEPVSGNAKNKKPATTTKGKTTTKTPTPKISESQKYKQSKEKSPPNQHHQQNQPDKSKSPPSTKHTEDNSKKIIPKSVPQQEKSKKPIVSNLNSKATVPKSKHVRIVGNINDHDCDGIPDDIDEDVDNDGLLDRTQDSDWDGLLNHIDEDDDNDGIPDVEDEDLMVMVY
ncbi:unnamed protein product [Heterobilharzia americana]|nr:unnamed protein product [Heterobilharzia americana]